jgi:hypothetical protein
MSSIQPISGVKRSADTVASDPYILAKRRSLLACKTAAGVLAKEKEEMEKRHAMEIKELNSKVDWNAQDSMEARFALYDSLMCIVKKNETDGKMWFEIVEFVNFEGDCNKLETVKTTLKNTCFFADKIYRGDPQWKKIAEEKLCEWVETPPPEKDCVLTMDEFLAKYSSQ